MNDLTKGRPIIVILRFTLPLLIGSFFQLAYNFADSMIVGHTLGEEAFASVGTAGSLIFLIVGFAQGLTSGLAIVTAQRFGAKDTVGLRHSFVHGLFYSILVSLVLTVLSLIFLRPILELLQTPVNLIEHSYAFMVAIFGGMVFTILYNYLSAAIRSLGDSTTPLLALILACIINIILDFFFILNVGWGVFGAGFATVTAQAVSVLYLLFHIKRKIPQFHLTKSDWKLDKDNLKKHAQVGFPMGFQASIIAIGALTLQAMLNQLGTQAIAAQAIASKTDQLAMLPMINLGLAVSTFTAQNYGAQNILRIKQGVNQCILMSGLFSLGIGIINIFYGGYMASFFVGPGETKVISLAQTYLHISGLFYWILALLFIYRYTLQGLGKSLVPTIAGIMELFMRIFAAVYMANYFGFTGVCSASPLAWIGSAVPLIIAYYYTMKYQFKT